MEDTVAGMILEKSDDIFDEALIETGWKSYVKAFWSGMIKGFVDTMFVVGIMYECSCIYKIFKKKD